MTGLRRAEAATAARAAQALAPRAGGQGGETFTLFAQWRVPIALVGTQWEQQLYRDKSFFSLPADENPMFSLARVLGEKGRREWLVYAHSPLGDRRGVEITIPDHGPVTLNASVGGSFCLVDEREKSVTPVAPSMPAAGTAVR